MKLRTPGLRKDELILHGQYKAKVSLDALARLADRPRGRYVLVTAINPTPLGEGKTTTAVGLVMGLCHLGQRAVVNLRQPSLGPVFGLKGGGTGFLTAVCSGIELLPGLPKQPSGEHIDLDPATGEITGLA